MRISDARQVLLAGWISVSNNAGKNVLEVGLSESPIHVLPQVLGRVRDMFDLYCDPFELSVRAILGQQITVKAVGTLAGRIVSKFGTHIKTPVEGLTHAFPTVESLLNLGGDIENYLGPLGVTAGRARAIRDLAKAMTDGLGKTNVTMYLSVASNMINVIGNVLGVLFFMPVLRGCPSLPVFFPRRSLLFSAFRKRTVWYIGESGSSVCPAA